MKHLVNVVSENGWLNAYKDREDMLQFVRDCCCDGVEVIRGGPDDTGIYTPDYVVGCHLLFYPNWIDFWHGNTAYLEKHFRSRELWEGYYQSKDREAFKKLFQADMDYAEAMGAEYVVFHVSDVSNEEVFSYRWEHTDREILDASAELLNELTDGRNYHFKLLLENLFTPGHHFIDPAETEYLLDRVRYENTGLLLDTGHLMNANQHITDAGQGLRWVMDCVERHGALAKYIKGVHLHQSLSGGVLAEMLTQNIVPEKDFYDCFAQSYAWILKIDQHDPITNPMAYDLLEKIDPEYVVHEISAPDRASKVERVRLQMHTLGRC